METLGSWSPRHCPWCATSLTAPPALVTEMWNGHDTVYYCWCPSCGWRGEVAFVARLTAPELIENEDDDENGPPGRFLDIAEIDR